MDRIMKLPSDFRDLICAFNAAGVEYLVVGAFALGVHGVPRYTGDLDIFFNPVEENARRVFEALKSFGYSSSELTVESLLEPDTVHYLGRPPLRVDLLNSISGVLFSDAWATRMIVRLDSDEFPVLGREALMKNKSASARPKDLVDLELLRQSKTSTD